MTFALEGIDAGYSRVQVLRDVSLTVNIGEIVALAGPSRAGKSTLLRAATGMIPTMAGRIGLRGRNLTGASIEAIARAGIAHVPEGRRLFPGLSVRDNLRLGGWRIRNTNLTGIVTLFPRLGERLDQPAGSLSGCEQQMCAVGRALMGKPEYLLIDELLLGLDPAAVDEILASLAGVAATGTGVLLVERDGDAALGVASRAYLLENGCVQLPGQGRVLVDDRRVRAAYLGV
ncbi:MAG: ATP-binding cassette domain-containing protein [Dactylosporangium sp.]|nr:ATP-binding cassette domain-containing protein [Dactylosporangium sp.]NNJ60041.1 ATP-binding cassette domain-containing protein [Dactylosporangium sp.]